MKHQKKQSKVLGGLVGLLLLAGGFASEAGAVTTYNLGCVTAVNTCTPSINWGTISFAQNGNNVDVTIDLIADYKIQSFGLNTTNATGTYDTVPGGVGVIENFNNVQVQGNGSYVGRFDLRLPDPPPGSLGVNSGTWTISWSGGFLNVNALALALDTNNLLYAAVHVGNCGSNLAACPNDSIQVGTGDPRTPPVPEPSTVILLGSGLVGLGLWRRKATKI